MANAPTKRPSKTKSNEFKRPPLTSLIDTVTIIMFYLMTQMGTSAITNPMVPSVPYSNSKEEAQKGVTFGLDKTGLYQEKVDFKTNNPYKEKLADVETLQSMDFELPRFQAVLEEAKLTAERLKTPLPNLTVQVDSMITYHWVLKLMNIASSMQYKKVDFIVVNPSL